MAVSRQGESRESSHEHGRVNQKQRTRTALVNAARELLAQGVTPTVAQAAEAALVSRATAYRYFPTQDSLLVELSLTVDVSDLEQLVQQPVDASGAPARVLEVIGALNRHVHEQQVQYRTAVRLYQDQWLEASAEGDDAPVVREGRRTRWLETTLAPFAGTVPDADLARLVHALSLLCGAEAMIVLRDVCHLDTDEALALTEWAAATLIEATLTGAGDRRRRDSNA